MSKLTKENIILINNSNKCFKNWSNIINRCYNKDYHKTHPTYINCHVCDKWMNFYNFAKWHEENYKPEFMKDFELDKDILVKGNKIYSPETCCFVPSEINKLFTKSDKARGEYPIGVRKTKNNTFVSRYKNKGVKIHIGTFKTPEEAFNAYKIAKEKHIKEIADKWKSQITERVYQAMYNYKVDIKD